MPGAVLSVGDPGMNLNMQKWNKKDFETISIYTYVNMYSICKAIISWINEVFNFEKNSVL